MNVIKFIKSIRNKIFLFKLLESILIFLTVLLSLILVNYLLYNLNPENGFYGWLILLLEIATALSAIFLTRKTSKWFLTDINTAKLLDKRLLLREQLVTSVQFVKDRNEYSKYYSPQFMDETVSRTSGGLKRDDANKAIEKKSLHYVIAVFSAIACIFIFCVLLGKETFAKSILRLSSPVPEKHGRAVNVSPGNAVVLEYSDVEITAVPQNGDFEGLLIEFKFENGDWEIHPMTDESNVFKYYFRNVKENFRYRIIYVDGKTDLYEIRTTFPPDVIEYEVSLRYPSYMRAPDRNFKQKNFEAEAVTGAKINALIKTNKTVTKCSLNFPGEDSAEPPKAGDNAFRLITTINGDKTFSIELIDEYGFKNQNPIKGTIREIRDGYPKITVHKPKDFSFLPSNGLMRFEFSISDDNGFKDCFISHKINEGEYQREYTNVPDNGAETVISHNIDVSKLPLKHGDEITCFVSVRDNDAVAGFKQAVSKTLKVKVPSASNISQSVQTRAKEQYDNLTETKEKQIENIRDIDNLLENLPKKDNLDWTMKEKIKDVTKTQSEIAKRLEDISKNMETMAREMESFDKTADRRSEIYDRIQKLLKELSAEPMQKAISNVSRATERMSPEDREQLLKLEKYSEEEFLEIMERALDLLRKNQMEQRLETLALKAEEMLKSQYAVNSKTAEYKEKDMSRLSVAEQFRLKNLAKKESGISEDLTGIEKEMNEILQSFGENEKNILKSVLNDIKQSKLKANLDGAVTSLNDKEINSAIEKENNATMGLQRLADNLRKTQAGIMKSDADKTVGKIRKEIKKIVEISRSQEDFHGDVNTALIKRKNISRDNPLFAEFADRQTALKNNLVRIFTGVIEIMHNTVMIKPETLSYFRDAMSDMDRIFSNLSDGNLGGAYSNARKSMEDTNKILTTLMESEQKMQNMVQMLDISMAFKRLEMMAQMQMSLKEQAERMLAEGNHGRDTLDEMADRQKEIMESGKEVKDAFEQSSQPAGGIGEALKEMEEVEKALRDGTFDRKLIQKQKEIIKHLLNAQKSLKTEEYDKQRLAEQPKEFIPARIPEAPERKPTTIDEIKERINEMKKNPVHPKYRRLVEDYYRNLYK